MASLVRREFHKRPVWYIQYYIGNRQKRIRASESYQMAKEKLRQFESQQARGVEYLLPTKTSLPRVIGDYVRYSRARKMGKSAQTDIYYLRSAFGPICDELQNTSRRITPQVKKRPRKPGEDRRYKPKRIEADYFEFITTADISGFIASRVERDKLSPRTANHFRAILMHVFNWAMKERGIRIPGDKNPAAAVRRYREPAPQICFLTLEQIQEQLLVLENQPQFQAMVAAYIYSGLRREELLWLTHADIDWEAKPYGLIRVRAKTVGDETWQPKTKVNRAVPISSQLRPYLDKQRLRSAKSRWFFPNSAGGRYDPDNLSSDLRRVNKAAGLTWTCLHYRHTFASQLAKAGRSLYQIAKIMGNSPEICHRHYAALRQEEMADVVEFPSTSAVPQSSTAVPA